VIGDESIFLRIRSRVSIGNHLHPETLRVYTSGASWATVCQQAALSKGTAQRRFSRLAQKPFAVCFCERRGLDLLPQLFRPDTSCRPFWKLPAAVEWVPCMRHIQSRAARSELAILGHDALARFVASALVHHGSSERAQLLRPSCQANKGAPG